MRKISSLQEFVLEMTKAVQAASPEERAQFRAAWLVQCDPTTLRLTGADVRWLKGIKIDSSGD